MNHFEYQQQPLMQKEMYKNDEFIINNDFQPIQQNSWAEESTLKTNNQLLTDPVACDLRDVIVYYQSQPDLLRLILSSKVEEDKRRTEEAKLRAKELDLLLLKQKEHTFISSNDPNSLFNHHLINGQNEFGERRPSAIDILLEDDCIRRDSALGSSFDSSSNSNDELDDRTFSPISSNSTSAAASIFSLNFPQPSITSIMTNQKDIHPLSPPFSFNQPEIKSDQPRSSCSHDNSSPKTRRRREMQAISKIVETRENPYNDGFFWKNNGNTIQKKTGNRSIYYKCSNSTKGCPVNKTVTAKENGEYLIKYRGEHLLNCDDSKQKRLKVGRACHPCRMKKIKCDGKQPCMQCKARRRKCSYLKNTDDNLIKLQPLDSSETTDPIDDSKKYTPDRSHSLFATQPDMIHTDQPQPSSSTRPDKMIRQLTEGLVQLSLNTNEHTKLVSESVTPWRSYGEFVCWTPEPQLPNHYSTPIEMPSRSSQEQWIDLFFTECSPHLLPILSRSLFYDQLHIKGPLITPLLLNVIYAHAAKRSSSHSTEEEIYYDRARKLMDDFLNVPRISTVIALIYLALYEPGPPRSSRAWMYSGMAIRMCFELGLHTSHYSSQMSQCDIELRKRVLWACFVMDKLESCTMERPWMLTSKDIAIDLPIALPENTVGERILLEAFNQLCKLMMLVEKVIRFFTYDVQALWTVREENQILQFLDTLYRWREMLPAELRWTENEIPPLAAIVNLHLLCHDLELSLIMCCRQNEHRDRRRTLASAITTIVSLTLKHPHLIYAPSFSAFSTVFAALTHAVDFHHPLLAEEAQREFRKSLRDIRLLMEKKAMPDLRNFSRLIDLTLQPKETYTTAFSAISDLCQHDLFPPPSSLPFLPSSPSVSAAPMTASAVGTPGSITPSSTDALSL
ncbi:hypothetical protein G6F17_005413 [Rhizopus arrhizus]|nr:hypothetical protein G6F17_005413 [Rhizopus arrhizus]